MTTANKGEGGVSRETIQKHRKLNNAAFHLLHVIQFKLNKAYCSELSVLHTGGSNKY